MAGDERPDHVTRLDAIGTRQWVFYGTELRHKNVYQSSEMDAETM